MWNKENLNGFQCGMLLVPDRLVDLNCADTADPLGFPQIHLSGFQGEWLKKKRKQPVSSSVRKKMSC